MWIEAVPISRVRLLWSQLETTKTTFSRNT